MSWFNRKTILGEYPCDDYLNNALRFLLRTGSRDPLIVSSISEICHCISKSRGRFADDVAHELAKTGLCPFTIERN